MSTCIKCGKYFSITRQTDYCPTCELSERANVSNCDIPLPQGFGKQEGWICPVCGRGVAPWADYCPCQSDWKITYGTGTNETYDIQSYLEQTKRMIKEVDSELGLDNMRRLLEG